MSRTAIPRLSDDNQVIMLACLVLAFISSCSSWVSGGLRGNCTVEGAFGGDTHGFAWSGRWWGIWNRARFPEGSDLTIGLSTREAVQLNRLARRWLRGRSRSAQRYLRKIASRASVSGYSCMGLPSGVAARMVVHAKDLASG